MSLVVKVERAQATLSDAFTYQPPAAPNAAPAIVGIRAQGIRPSEPPSYAALGERIMLQAAVTDDTASVADLLFEWASDKGMVVGAGAEAWFVAPTSAGKATITLSVVERLRSTGSSGTARENRTTAKVEVSVHDEVSEISRMAEDFLRLFSVSTVPAAETVHNFKDGCGVNGTGKRDELQQIDDNRRNYTILPDWSVGTAASQVSFNGVSPFRARRADGWAAVPVRWHSECRVRNDSIGCPSIGFRTTTSGTDWVTAIYDQPTERWWLCDSDYSGSSNVLSFMVP